MSSCKHNEGINCSTHTAAKCAVCGWNPKVHAKRKKRITDGGGLVCNNRTGMSYLLLKKGV